MLRDGLLAAVGRLGPGDEASVIFTRAGAAAGTPCDLQPIVRGCAAVHVFDPVGVDTGVNSPLRPRRRRERPDSLPVTAEMTAGRAIINTSMPEASWRRRARTTCSASSQLRAVTATIGIIDAGNRTLHRDRTTLPPSSERTPRQRYGSVCQRALWRQSLPVDRGQSDGEGCRRSGAAIRGSLTVRRVTRGPLARTRGRSRAVRISRRRARCAPRRCGRCGGGRPRK